MTVVAGRPPTAEEIELARQAIERRVAEQKLTPDDAQVVRQALDL